MAFKKLYFQEQLQNVTSNEVNLLNRIKCLEAEEGYSHAEVEKILTKEKEMNEAHQELLYRIECLETELDNANKVIEEQKSQVVVQRSEDDIAMIAQQEGQIKSLTEEISYYKQELIEARARKSASDDELGTVRGKLETMENQITTLSNEGTNTLLTPNSLMQYMYLNRGHVKETNS